MFQTIQELTNSYYEVTGITTLFMDKSLQIKCISNGLTVEELHLVGFNEVLTFIEDITSNQKVEKDSFYTLHTKNNCIYNLAFIVKDFRMVGIFIAGAMVLSSSEDMQFFLDKSKNHKVIMRGKDRNDLMEKMVTVNYTRLNTLGRMLVTYVASIYCYKECQQILTGDWNSNDQLDKAIEIRTTENFVRMTEETMILPQDVYYRLKELLQNGNVPGMEKYLSNLGNVPIDRIIANKTYESVKAYCIAAITTSFCFAVEADAPYQVLSVLTTTLINIADQQKSVYDLLYLIRRVFISFTQEVAIHSHKSYSKPVKQIMKYIHENIKERISLSELSEYTGYSSYYLSKLIRKETNMSLSENINLLRIKGGKQLLKNTQLSILEIAQLVGFRQQNHFSNIFKKVVGITPSQFRNSVNN
ncbi:MAG TPA: AraC family transcriptional regulator [Lachnospiraceae bacterium]|nr:AraC family transcriptional regulator [Lachnospiraceae bacterium]